jgi:hypothetical protein
MPSYAPLRSCRAFPRAMLDPVVGGTLLPSHWEGQKGRVISEMKIEEKGK